MRITNAPTEHQRKLYQKKLEELTEAFNFLGGESPENNIHELPGMTESEVVEVEKQNNSSALKENNFESEQQNLINKAILLTEALMLLNVKETSSSAQIEKAYYTKKSDLEIELRKTKIEAVKQVCQQELEKLSMTWQIVEPWLQGIISEEKIGKNNLKKVEALSKQLKAEKKNLKSRIIAVAPIVVEKYKAFAKTDWFIPVLFFGGIGILILLILIKISQ
jgi:hypothetical protein